MVYPFHNALILLQTQAAGVESAVEWLRWRGEVLPMSSDVSWHIRDKLWPMPKHGSVNLYVHGNHWEGSLGRTAQDVHLDSHTAPELWLRWRWRNKQVFKYTLGLLIFSSHKPMESELSSQTDLACGNVSVRTDCGQWPIGWKKGLVRCNKCCSPAAKAANNPVLFITVYRW